MEIMNKTGTQHWQQLNVELIKQLNFRKERKKI
jgi:hypothetical protein